MITKNRMHNDIAIIGMGCIFPRSRNLKEYWHLLFNGIDAIEEIPGDTHWKLKDYFDKDPATRDHTYCKRGGFLPKINFDPLKYGIPPNNIEVTDTSQLLGLEVARMALEDAGYPANHPELKEKKVNVILGVTGTQELVIPLGARLGHPIWKKALEDSGISEDKKQEVIERIQGDYVQWQENSFPGLLGNVVAGRIANRLNLSGTNTVTDAACASSLSAIHTAVMELVSGKCDMSITGGVDALNDIFMHMCFSKTGVLSHTSDAKPFSKDADGTVLGEGIGMLVLKRLDEAEKDSDQIYAVIKSVGTSSDGRTSAIYAPEAKGQIKALNEAYNEADITPSSIELLEAHGTGTRVGDKVEFDALKSSFQQSSLTKNKTAIGSVKSMIGHTKAAAGAAGIIKAALSLHNKVLPPTLKALEPDPELNINDTSFYLNSSSKPWMANPLHPRRSGVSAFGFGGSNFHIVLEEYNPLKTRVSWDGGIQIIAFSSDAKDDLIDKINLFKTDIDSIDDTQELKETIAWKSYTTRLNFSSHHDFRLLIVLKLDDDIIKTLENAINCIDRIDNDKTQSNIYFSSGKQKGKLGFLFPGQGSQYTGMGRDLFSVFPEALNALEQAQNNFDALNNSKTNHKSNNGADIKAERNLLHNYIFPAPTHLISKKESENLLRQTDVAQPAIGALSLAMINILKKFSINPHITCGHSFGELSALCSAGWINEDEFCKLASARGKYMAEANDEDMDSGSMLAVKAPLKDIENLIIKEKLDLVLANKNSRTQGILSGATKEILRAKKICRQEKISAIKLPVAAAFHTKLVQDAVKPFKKDLSDQIFSPTSVDVFSNTTGTTYSKKDSEIKKNLGNQLINPVNFIDNIQGMLEHEVSTFVELGPKSVLTDLTKSILKENDITAMALDRSAGKRSGIEDLAHVLCMVASKGFSIDLSQWEDAVDKPEIKKLKIPLSGANQKPKNRCRIPKASKQIDKNITPEPKTNNSGTSESGAIEHNIIPGNQYKKPVSKPNQKSLNNNSSTLKGSDMTLQQNGGHNMNLPAYESMKMVQQGLEAMQQLQTQTAHAHEKFLETQAQASKTLANMMEQTRNFAFNTPSMLQQENPPVSDPTEQSFEPALQDNFSPDIVQTGITNIEPKEIEPDLAPDITPNTEIDQQSQSHQPRVQAAQFIEPIVEETPVNNNSNVQTKQTLFDIVSTLTGFPVDMLEADMNIESDLGIDSIKKVEIISELEKQIPSCEGLTTENISTVKTLQDICNAIQETEADTITSNAVTTDTITPDITSNITIDEINNNDFINETHNDNEEQTTDSYQAVSTVLINTISELTGFPVDMLEPSMGLESDLGIDSIKRVEILSKLEQELDSIETISSEGIANLKTIEEIIIYLTQSEKINVTEQKKTSDFNYSQKKIDDSPSESIKADSLISDGLRANKKLTRQVVRLKQYPINQIRFYNGSIIELPVNKKIYITKDSSQIADKFKTQFEKSGIKAELIDISKGNIPRLPDAAGLVLLPDSFKKRDHNTAINFIKSAFLLIQKNSRYLMEAGKTKGAFLSGISFLGGNFAFSDQTSNQPSDKAFNCDPVYGGLAGLIKTAGIEWNDVLCRALDMPDSIEQCMEHSEAAASLMMTHGSVEMGLDGDNCNIPSLIDQEVLESVKLNLDSDDVVVITGGAKGVTAACAIELARQYSPAIMLIGRSASPSFEPDWAKGIQDSGILKKAILTHEFKNQKPKPADIQKIYKKIISNREMKQNIQLMKDNGSKVKYFSVDIRDKKEINTVFKAIRKEFKHITAIMHGAGVLEDKLIVDKKMDRFNLVFDTKIEGLDSLLPALQKDNLKYFVFFSSIAARMGNQGQCDYAIANEILNKTAQKLSITNPGTKILSVNWGPWEGGMVDSSLKKEFLKRGIELIPLQYGAKQLLKEMENIQNSNPEIVIGAPLLKKKKSKRQKLSKAMTLSMGADSAPVLNSHTIAGDLVVPFALLMDIHAHAAKKNNPGLVFAGMDDMRLLKGVKPGKSQVSMDINLGKCMLDKNGYKTLSTISSSKDGNNHIFTHSSCTILLKETLPAPPVLSQAAFMDLKPYPLTPKQAYKDILFHGKDLQCIQSIDGYSQKGIGVTTSLSPNPDKWLKKPYTSKWAIEPVMLDAAFQAAILWSYKKMGQVCLPGFIANLRIYSSFENLKGNIKILFTVNEESKTKIKGYFTFLDEKNRVVASITGFEAITDLSLNDKFKTKPLFDRKSILAFAKGDPSKAFGEKYKIFDKERQIARLPRPPYFFMDRVVNADHPQWQMKGGGWIETQYDIPENEWYFNANRTDTIPFCILLEIALQPCGWLAAYAGSALESSERLYFRNLGGHATLIQSLTRHSGTITIRTRMSDVSKAGGMIIQNFDLQLLCDDKIVYQGKTNFGFFTNQALSNQIGIRENKFSNYLLPEKDHKKSKSYTFKNNAPVTPDDENSDKNDGMPSKALRMIDKIEILSFDAGLYNNGYIKATKKVDPSEWFFNAHFYQDPVCPGSLGVESFLQMIRFFLVKKFNITADKANEYEVQISPENLHEWIYRGQIIPENKKITIHSHIKSVTLPCDETKAGPGHDNDKKDDFSVIADGALTVDGICIYEMKNFGLMFSKIPSTNHILKERQVSEK
ncbi:SDR family NAD(P)-dependent oxidoreductase [Desulfobacterales bacterium HSG17]|nr:SDR family NAD(P)-dependent oxidoreductase [Desulfobacterales bacterium HSG17]